MKKLLIGIVGLAVIAAIAWPNRLNILMWGAPKLKAIASPVAPNREVAWPQGPKTASKAPEERPPNVILIMTDDMGFNDVSLYNGAAAGGQLKTPSIDAIAHQGIRFDNGYSGNAVCSPSRAIALTGRYNTRSGFEFTPVFKLGFTIFNWMEQLNPLPKPNFIDMDVAETLPAITEMGMPSSEFTIAELLKQKGYYTAHIGKWHLGSVNGMRPEEQGFDDSLYMKGGLYLPADHPDVVNQKFPEDPIDKMVWATAEYAVQWNGGEKFEPANYLTDYFTDESVKMIKANRHQPFFLYLAHWSPHNPLQATKADYEALSHIKDHGMRVYGAMLRAVDRSVKRITETLEEQGLSDNTLIVFTSDNGAASYIQLGDLNQPYRGWKLNLFEGGVHVPYMMKWPAQFQAGKTVKSRIHHMDLFHTIANAAGAQHLIPTDRKMDGVNLLPFISGEKTGEPHKTLFWRNGYHQSVLHEDWKLIRANQPDLGPGAPQKQFLFNLANDPTEQNNLIAKHPEKALELSALLAAHNAEQAEPLFPSALQSAQRIDKHGGEPWEDKDEFIYWPN